MNERIRELQHQCWVKVPCDFDMRKGGLSTINTVFDYEKFAELIVKECDRYVAEHYDECEPWMQPGDLLKHFGVE